MKGGNRFIKGFVKEVAKEFPVEGASIVRNLGLEIRTATKSMARARKVRHQ